MSKAGHGSILIIKLKLRIPEEEELIIQNKMLSDDDITFVKHEEVPFKVYMSKENEKPSPINDKVYEF